MQKSYFGPNSEYHSKGGKADILCLNMKEKKIVGTELKINPPLSLWLGIKFHYLSYKTTILLLMFPTCCLQYFISFAFKIIQIGKTFLGLLC